MWLTPLIAEMTSAHRLDRSGSGGGARRAVQLPLQGQPRSDDDARGAGRTFEEGGRVAALLQAHQNGTPG